MNEAIEPAELAVLALGRLRQGVRTRPVTTLAAVFGAGFVLGRGLPTFLVRLGSAFALRAIAGRVLVRSLQASDPTFGEAHG
jgi:hypothetical protein